MKAKPRTSRRNLDRSYQSWLNAGRRITYEVLNWKLQFWFCLAWAFWFAAAVSTYALVTRH